MYQAPIAKKAQPLTHTNDQALQDVAALHPAGAELLQILELPRETGSIGEGILIHYLMEKYPFEMDDYGNLFYLNQHAETMFTAHTDTVHSGHKNKRKQTLCYDAQQQRLFTDSDDVLGADDGAGIWLILRLIDANVAGLYYLFRDEEVGRKGSTWVCERHLHKLTQTQRCISFDRKGTDDIVATQRSQVCCSEEFQDALAHELNLYGAFNYKPGAKGSYTDSATFMDIIPECTNISVGYYNQHTASESQDLHFLFDLADALVNVDWDQLPTERDPNYRPPAPVQTPTYTRVSQPVSTSNDANDYWDHDPFDEAATLDDLAFYTSIQSIVEDFPELIADMLEDFGFDADTLRETVKTTYYAQEDTHASPQPTH